MPNMWPVRHVSSSPFPSTVGLDLFAPVPTIGLALASRLLCVLTYANYSLTAVYHDVLQDDCHRVLFTGQGSCQQGADALPLPRRTGVTYCGQSHYQQYIDP